MQWRGEYNFVVMGWWGQVCMINLSLAAEIISQECTCACRSDGTTYIYNNHLMPFHLVASIKLLVHCNQEANNSVLVLN
uniref:Predicted protein n=1 Tax=Hordeum vulgare subsp. vulgare TaxID=112509 RepID=F2E7F5_HORVV|nr:predicted protein [Hordeum vulgare subsp. vulgare]